MTEQIVIILIVVAVLVVLDGLRRKFGERRDRVVIKLDKSAPRSDPEDDELFKSELPNGGARTMPRKGEISRPAKPAPKLKSLAKRQEQVSSGTVPVLLDAVELEEEQIEHTNVFADTSSTPAALEDAESEEGGTMGMHEDRIEFELEEIIEGLDDEDSEPATTTGKPTDAADEEEPWDEDIEADQEGDDEADQEIDEFWDEDWADEGDEEEGDVEDDEEDSEEDDFDVQDDDEEFDEDEDDEGEDDEELPTDFGDYEVDDEQYRDKREVQAGRIEPTFGEENKRRPGFAAGFLSKIDQGELFRDDSEPKKGIQKSPQKPAEELPQEVIIINVMARSGSMFDGQELLPVLQLQGMRLGDMSIFHKHSGSNATGTVIFSMANMVKPGTFDLAAMDDFTTPGVSFFLQLPNKFGNMASFDQMLTAANALKHSLDGELKDENRSVFTRQTIEHCRQRIRDFELKMLARK
jgi:cell division protein ZipA